MGPYFAWAENDRSRGNLVELNADSCFGPHSLPINEGDFRYGSIAEVRSQANNVVKYLLGRAFRGFVEKLSFEKTVPAEGNVHQNRERRL